MAKSVKLKEADTFIDTEGIRDFTQNMSQAEINAEFFRIKPMKISDLLTAVSGIKFVDDGANYAFRIGDFLLFNANINVTKASSFSIPIKKEFKPKYNTRICSNTDSPSTNMPYTSTPDCAIVTAGNIPTGQWHLFGLYELANPRNSKETQ